MPGWLANVGRAAGKLVGLLFGCRHRRLSRPLSTPARKGEPGQTYVVCLDCGKRLAYDMLAMRMGKELK